jgi:hypothetical protein
MYEPCDRLGSDTLRVPSPRVDAVEMDNFHGKLWDELKNGLDLEREPSPELARLRGAPEQDPR